jgi:hypothetical protein
VDVATALRAVAHVETGEATEEFDPGSEFLGGDFGWCGDGGWRPGLEHCARGDELHVDVARREQAVVAQFDEAVGQDVQQEAGKEFVRVQRRDVFATGAKVTASSVAPSRRWLESPTRCVYRPRYWYTDSGPAKGGVA